MDSKENKWLGSLKSWSKEGTVRHRQSKEASILWSHHEETRELPGERDNARKEQCQVQEGEEGHARPGWTTSRRGQDSPWKSQSEWQRTGINGESTSMVWPTLGSGTAKEQNRTLTKPGGSGFRWMRISSHAQTTSFMLLATLCATVWHLEHAHGSCGFS